jgi:hypothetical protein
MKIIFAFILLLPVLSLGQSVNQSQKSINSTYNTEQINSNELDQLYQSLAKFDKGRVTGKSIQLLGYMAMGVAIILTHPTFEMNPNTIRVIAGSGVAVSAAGIYIDIESGRHLKRK